MFILSTSSHACQMSMHAVALLSLDPFPTFLFFLRPACIIHLALVILLTFIPQPFLSTFDQFSWQGWSGASLSSGPMIPRRGGGPSYSVLDAQGKLLCQPRLDLTMNVYYL